MATNDLKVAFNVAQMYQFYSLHDGDREPKNFPMKVPLALQINGSFGTTEEPEGIDLCFLIDRSSSMKKSPGEGWTSASTRHGAVIETLRELASVLNPNDRVSLMAFDHRAVPVATLRPASELPTLVDQLPEPEGATYIALALQEGVKMMSGRPGNRPGALVLLTDGDAYMPSGNTKEERQKNVTADLERSAQEALAATAYLQNAGLDLVTLGFGDEWNEQLLNKLDGCVGQHGVRYIDTQEKAKSAFHEVTQEQQSSILSNVRLEAEINTDAFMWERAWMVLPRRTVGRPVEVKGRARLAEANGGRWTHTFGNVQHAATTGYSLIVTARPLGNLSPGEHVIGRFRFQVGNEPITLWQEAKLQVQEEAILGSVSVPQNPNPLVQQNWLLAMTSDLEAEKNEHIHGKRHSEAQRVWEQILHYYELAKNQDELGQERQEYEAYCQSHSLSSAQIKKRNEIRTSTSAPVSRRIHEQLMDFEEGAKVYTVEGKPDGSLHPKEETYSEGRRPTGSTHVIIRNNRRRGARR